MKSSQTLSAGKRRVLIIVQNLPVPYDRRVWLEATTLARHGYVVSVICPRTNEYWRRHEVLEGVHIYRYWLPEEGTGKIGLFLEAVWCLLMASCLSLWIACFGPGFDVLHVCNPPETYWPLGRFWRCFGRRFIFDHHDLSPELFQVKFRKSRGLLYNITLWLERQTFRTADVVITTNGSYKAIAERRGHKAPEDIFIVRSGPDLKRLHIHPRDERLARGKSHLLVYLGEIGTQDGIDHLLHALQRLRFELGRQDFFCILIGGGPHQPAMVQYAKKLHLSDVVEFTGRISDTEEICRILSSATIGLDPSPKDPFSDKSTMNKIVEMMFFGLPIVSFDLHETRVSAGEATVYAKPNADDDFARKISDLLDDPERRRRLSPIGMSRTRDSFAWDYSVPPLLAAYDRVFAIEP